MINYNNVLETYPWLIQRNQNAIISFDTDGWVTGVLLSEILNWNIVGYYDSKNLILKNGIRTDDCVFIDVEIFRNTKRSFGHHLIMYDFNNLPADFNERTAKCFNPNFIRQFDTRNHYRRKYPLATFHLYDKLLRESGIGSIDLNNDNALSVVWFIDGVMNNKYKYGANVNEWIEYLEMENENWWIQMNARTESNVKLVAANFINEINEIADYSTLKKLTNFHPDKLSKLITLITQKFGIEKRFENWCSEDYSFIPFDRRYMDVNTQQNFDTFWNSNPFSMSTYFQQKISYTLEGQNLLP